MLTNNNLSMKIRLIILILLCIFFNTTAQVYLSQGFESGAIPSGWTQETVLGSVSWRYRTGGGGYVPDTITYLRKPPTAHSGKYNAFFQVEQIGPTTKLVTAPIDLSTAKRPELTFWHAQYPWGGPTEFDKLYVYYKVNKDSAWHKIGSYTTVDTVWTQESIFLPPTRLSSTYYLAFEGQSNWGWGVVLDDIAVTERGIIPMNVKSFTISGSNENIVPSKEKNAPILELDLNLYGNTGAVKLDSMKFTSLNTSNSDINNLGVKLFVTNTPNFIPTNQVGSAVNFTNGIAKFSNLNYTLNYGEKYFWLTYDVGDSAHYGDILDAKVTAGSINLHFDTTGVVFNPNLYLQGDSIIYIIGGVRNSAPLKYYLPNVETSPAGNTIIYQSVFYDDFDTDKGWILQGDFQRTAPQGKGGTDGGYPDPTIAYSAPDELGTDLTGLGAVPGDYENDVSTPYWAQSPASNCFYYNNLKLIYKRQLNIESFDYASIEMSPDSGQTWVYVWNNMGSISESAWENNVIDLSSFNLNRKSGIITRFTLGPTDISDTRSGWNIDNFAIAGNYIETDVGISKIISPSNGCGHTSSDSVTVIVKNYGAKAVSVPIPVKFSLNGGSSYITDTVKTPIPFKDSITFTFKNKANISTSGIYNVIAKTFLSTDEDHTNDSIVTTLYAQPTLELPYFETFESTSGLWMPGGKNSSWQWGIPDASLSPVPSGYKVWKTNLLGNYNNNEYSYIESPCFDFAGADRQMLKFSYWLSAELQKDGFNIYYSKDNGKSWTLLDKNTYGWPWPWYNDTIRATGERGWVGGNATWDSLKQVIPNDLSLATKGKLRFVFQSDLSTVARGLAIDNVELQKLPPDIGVSSFPVEDTCQYILPNKIPVYIKNYGITSLNINDTIKAGLDFQSEAPRIETFLLSKKLSPGDSVLYSFKNQVDISTPKVYHIRAYTMIEKDPSFYGTHNDTLARNFEIWQNPVTLLQDTIFSREPDTVVIRPQVKPEYSFLWDDNSTAPTYHVTVPRTYKLTVTESTHGCHTSDSVYVQLLFNDVGIDSIIWPRSSCSLGSAERIKVQIRNFGTDSLIVGDKILVSYILNSGSTVKDSLTLSSSFHKGTIRWFEFDNKTEDFSHIGDYHIKSFSHFGGDTVSTNDSIARIIHVFGYPTLNLGNDTTVKALSYTMHVNPGFAHYLWSDGDTTANKTISTSGFYWLDILDNHGCAASDSIDIWLKIRDLKVNALLNPVSSCNRIGTEHVNLQLINNGTDTIKSSDNISVSYKIDPDTRVTESMNVSNLLPGQTVNHIFAPAVNLSAFGTYSFNLTATTAEDLRTSNDTLNMNVYTNSNPVVNFDVQDYVPIQATQHVFDAGYGHDYTYLWQDNSVNQTYTATDAGTVSVVVTDTLTGCIGGDTVYLNLDILDYKISSIDINSTSCEGEYKSVQVGILNNGNQLRPSASLTLQYRLDNTLLFSENYESRTNWAAGATRIYTTVSPIDLTPAGNQKLSVTVKTDGDLRPENDTFAMNIQVLALPDISLDSYYSVDLPYVLDAGSGFASYLWQNVSSNQTLSTSQTLNVSQDGAYSLTIKGTNGCSNSKNIYINVVSISNLAVERMNVEIYPNPATDYITVEAKFEDPGTYYLEIFNLQNTLIDTREIKTQEYKESFYVGNLAPGIYFIRIRNNEMYHISKMIVR